MKRLTLLFCVFILTQLSLSGVAMAKKKFVLKNQYLKLYKGEVKVVKIGAIERVAVGNGKILSTSITKKGQLIILAEKSGETIVHIWGKDGWERELKIKISESNPRSEESEIKSLLRDAPSLSVRTVGGRIVIDGAVGPDDALKIKVIKKHYPNILLLARETAASFHDKMIHMKVQITEFSSNALEEIGINWSTSISGPYAGFAAAPKSPFINPVTGDFVPPEQDVPPINPLAGTKGFGFFGILSSMSSRINLMQNNGDALILASPTLIARSGGEAEFLAGGQIPMPTTSQNGTNIEFKDYGIKLKIKPVADDEGNITASVETELSAPDLSTAVNGIPGFLSRKAQADLSMKDGETMVISGLMNSSLSKDTSGIKYLRDIPLIGALFRNKKTIDKKTELVIFVTPTIINANSRINKEGVAQHKELINKFREAVEIEDWLDEDSQNAEYFNDSESSNALIKTVPESVDEKEASPSSEVEE